MGKEGGFSNTGGGFSGGSKGSATSVRGGVGVAERVSRNPGIGDTRPLVQKGFQSSELFGIEGGRHIPQPTRAGRTDNMIEIKPRVSDNSATKRVDTSNPLKWEVLASASGQKTQEVEKFQGARTFSKKEFNRQFKPLGIPEVLPKDTAETNAASVRKQMYSNPEWRAIRPRASQKDKLPANVEPAGSEFINIKANKPAKLKAPTAKVAFTSPDWQVIKPKAPAEQNTAVHTSSEHLYPLQTKLISQEIQKVSQEKPTTNPAINYRELRIANEHHTREVQKLAEVRAELARIGEEQTKTNTFIKDRPVVDAVTPRPAEVTSPKVKELPRVSQKSEKILNFQKALIAREQKKAGLTQTHIEPVKAASLKATVKEITKPEVQSAKILPFKKTSEIPMVSSKTTQIEPLRTTKTQTVTTTENSTHTSPQLATQVKTEVKPQTQTKTLLKEQLEEKTEKETKKKTQEETKEKEAVKEGNEEVEEPQFVQDVDTDKKRRDTTLEVAKTIFEKKATTGEKITGADIARELPEPEPEDFKSEIIRYLTLFRGDGSYHRVLQAIAGMGEVNDIGQVAKNTDTIIDKNPAVKVTTKPVTRPVTKEEVENVLDDKGIHVISNLQTAA